MLWKTISVTGILTVFFTAALVGPANADRQPIEARLEIPLSGTKTTFRFSVRNNDTKSYLLDAPFANNTRLFVKGPTGGSQEFGSWKEGLTPNVIDAGFTKNWDIDISSHVKFTSKGTYVVWFQVRDVRSNTISIVKD